MSKNLSKFILLLIISLSFSTANASYNILFKQLGSNIIQYHGDDGSVHGVINVEDTYCNQYNTCTYKTANIRSQYGLHVYVTPINGDGLEVEYLIHDMQDSIDCPYRQHRFSVLLLNDGFSKDHNKRYLCAYEQNASTYTLPLIFMDNGKLKNISG